MCGVDKGVEGVWDGEGEEGMDLERDLWNERMKGFEEGGGWDGMGWVLFCYGV